jgi:glycine/D-amino acid oxidase-like deaminating enzyme
MSGDAQVRVAVVGPFTGPRDAWGELLNKGIGEVPHAPVRWERFDDRGEVTEAAARAGEVVAKGGFAAVLGHFNSQGAREALRIYRAAGLPVLLPLATAVGLLAGAGGMALRLCPDDAGQAATMLRACEQRGHQQLDVIDDGSDYGRQFAARLISAGRPDLLVRAVAPDAPTGGAVALCGVHHRVADLVRAGHCPGPGRLVLVPDDCDVPEFAVLVGPAAEGILVTRLAGGALGRVVAGCAALAGALAKYPGHRGAALLDVVRGELADELGTDGDPVGASSGRGWEVAALQPRRVHREAGSGCYDIAVVGVGAVGVATAAALAEAGARVALLGADPGGSSATAVSGALVRAFELEEPNRGLALRSFQLLWGRAEMAVACGMHRTGGLVLLGAEHLAQLSTGIARLRDSGLSAELLTSADLVQRWPDLDVTGVAAAVWEPAAGYAVPAVLRATLLDRARSAGAVMIPRQVRRLRAGARNAIALDIGSAAGGEVCAEAVVVAAGCASPDLLGTRWPTTRPARTKRIRYGVFECGERSHPAVYDLTTGVWGRPDGRGQYLVGCPVPEWDVPVVAGARLSAVQVEQIRTDAGRRFPWLGYAKLLAGRFGTDLYVSGGPVLGALPGTPRVVVAAGWSGAGFKTSPAAAEQAAAAALRLVGGPVQDRMRGAAGTCAE